MKLILDCREKKLIDICENLIKTEKTFKDVIMATKNLELGDIVIEDETGIEKLIIERKSFNDLVASIKDGRYTEQSYRLSGYKHHNHNIMYLIEGENINKHTDSQLIYSSTISVNYYKGFSVFRTLNTNETAHTILNWLLKIQKEEAKKTRPYYIIEKEGEEKGESEEKSYSSVIKSKKNANITKDNFLEIMLCQIPSVSTVTAVAISTQFKTLNNLINSIKNDVNCLNNVTYMTSKNQKRKLSKTCVKNIVEFLNQ